MKKIPVLLICLLLISSYGIIISIQNVAGGSPPPPNDGIDGLQYIDSDWVVNGVESYTNETIVLTGNLTIENGGRLTLKNVTLIMNSTAGGATYDDFFHIEVEKGGTMYILDYDNDNTTTSDASNITLNDTNAYYWFWVRDGSNFTMRNSELHECGGAAVLLGCGGFTVYTDNATIDHNLIYNNRYGIVLYGSDAMVSNNTISWNDHTGVMATAWSNGTIENNVIEWSDLYGIWVDGVDNINPKGSNPLIRGNIIKKTGRDVVSKGDALQITTYSNPRIQDTIVEDWGEDGMYLNERCNPELVNVTFKGEGGLFGLVGGGGSNRPTIINSSISNCVNDELFIAQSYFVLTNTTFNKTKVDFNDATSNLTINWFLNTYVNETFGNPVANANIRIKDNSNGTFDENFTTDSNGYLNWTVLKEYYQNLSTTISYTSHNITISKQGYFTFYADVQMNKSKYITITLQVDEKPEINHTPVSSANIGEIINITANITDDISVDSVYLNYTGVNVTNYNVSMDRWNGNWSCDIPGQGTTGIVDYFIWCNDSSGNDNQTTIYQIQINDVSEPKINHTPISSTSIDQLIDIVVNVTDDAEVSNVTLYYENVGDVTYTTVDMVLISANWTAIIPAQTETGLVHYFIWANDTSGNNITSPIMGDYAIQITGPPGIDITNPIGGEDWTAGSEQQIEFIVSDTEDALSDLDVFLNYTSSAGNGVIASIKGDESPYLWTLPIIDASDVKINVTVIDSDGNTAYDDSLEFSVDSSLPEASSTNPVDEADGISVNQLIVVQFDEPMNVSTVSVVQTGGANPGAWTWFWNEDKDTITGTHNSWARGEVVEITVQAGYKDDSDPGNANNTAYVFSFTTEINPSPEIVHTNISGSQELGDEIRINATITDDGAVMNAVIWWQDVDNTWHENYMQKDGDDWEYFITGPLEEGKVRYQINATDDLQQKNTTTIYEFNITDTTPPVIIHTPIVLAYVNNRTHFTCEVSDIGGINTSAVFFYSKRLDVSDFSCGAMVSNFSYWLQFIGIAPTIEYYIQAFDIYGNNVTTPIYTLEFIDIDYPIIEHNPTWDLSVNDDIEITAYVRDNVDVDSVIIYYRPFGSTTYNPVEMVKASSPSQVGIQSYFCTGTIPGDIKDTGGTYFIWANDTSGNENSTSVYQIEGTYDDIPPEIIFTIPTGSNVSIIANISVVFSEAMNQTSVESAISISPTISGISYTWLNDQTLVVHFSGVIPFNTTFSITIDTGAKDLAGNILANDYSWQFMTADEPEIVQPSVSNDWGWIIMIIILSAIIVLLLFYLFRERKEKEPEE